MTCSQEYIHDDIFTSDLAGIAIRSMQDLNSCLTNQDKTLYGERFPKGFLKIGILGKGRNSIVWLAHHLGTDDQIALKQVPKYNRRNASQGISNESAADIKAEVNFYKAILNQDLN